MEGGLNAASMFPDAVGGPRGGSWGMGEAQLKHLECSTSSCEGCPVFLRGELGCFAGFPSDRLECLSHTHLFPDAPPSGETTVRSGFLGQCPPPLSQLLGPVQPLSALVHPYVVLTDVTLTLSSLGIRVLGQVGWAKEPWGPLQQRTWERKARGHSRG